MKKIPFEAAQSLWVKYMVDRIFCKYAYPTLEPMPHISFEEWCLPDLYYIDGINKKELPIGYKGEDYFAEQIETLTEWLNRQPYIIK